MRKEVRRIPHQVGPTSDKRHDLDSRRDHGADAYRPLAWCTPSGLIVGLSAAGPANIERYGRAAPQT